jgi:hypothetical protein
MEPERLAFLFGLLMLLVAGACLRTHPSAEYCYNRVRSESIGQGDGLHVASRASLDAVVPWPPKLRSR